MSKDDSGKGFNLNILQSGTLISGKIADLLLGKFNVVNILFTKAVDTVVDFSLGESKIVTLPAIELDRHVAHGSIAAVGDIGKRRLDGIAHLKIFFLAHFGCCCGFQPNSHVFLIRRCFEINFLRHRFSGVGYQIF